MSARRALIASPDLPSARRPRTRRAVCATPSVAQRLKERIWTEFFPRLVGDILDQQASGPSPPALAAVQRQAQTLMLRLLILSLADARGMLPGRRGQASAWRQVQQRAASSSFGSTDWRVGVERCLQSYWSATAQTAALTAEVSPSLLAQLIEGLSHDAACSRREDGWIDYRLLDPRLLGEVYEGLLARTNAAMRKSSGSFYTPGNVVDYIVEQTLAPRLAEFVDQIRCGGADRRWGGVADQPDQLRVLDPAMGCGYFLLAVAGHLASRAETALGKSGHTVRRRLLQRAVRCLYGLDIDPLAVEVARASIWLQCRLDQQAMSGLNERLRCGNALLQEYVEDEPVSPDASLLRFDAIVGNPPYGAKLTPQERERACQRWTQMRHNADTAVGFLQASHVWLKPHGRCGLIVPKALTYSYSWRRLREHLADRVVELVDVSQMWRDVRLEQVILLSTAKDLSIDYQSRVWRDGNLTPRVPVAWRLAKRLDAWPCGLNRLQQRLASRLSGRRCTLGNLCRTFRGHPWQERLNSVGGPAVLGGRDLMRWGTRGVSGYLRHDVDLSRFAGPRLLFQNIVAHVLRPHPHLKLIGCYDATGRPTLDTVNNLVACRDDVDLHGILGLLHSQFVNWYVYAVIYNRAVRTMHFDQYFLNKIPLPPDWRGLVTGIAPLSKNIEEIVAKEVAARRQASDRQHDQLRQRRELLESQINDLVNHAYGWRPAAQ